MIESLEEHPWKDLMERLSHLTYSSPGLTLLVASHQITADSNQPDDSSSSGN
jgi:hypothetical protein